VSTITAKDKTSWVLDFCFTFLMLLKQSEQFQIEFGLRNSLPFTLFNQFGFDGYKQLRIFIASH